jgi:hypothetical protein
VDFQQSKIGSQKGFQVNLMGFTGLKSQIELGSLLSGWLFRFGLALEAEQRLALFGLLNRSGSQLGDRRKLFAGFVGCRWGGLTIRG